jgi:tRNA (guanine37-N1)-methyltransferase
MRFDVVTLFPEMFSALKNSGITGRAFRKEICELLLWNPRDFATDKRRTVDDRPYGGGPGMVMLAKPLEDAIEAVKLRHTEQGLPLPKVIYLSPQGSPLVHKSIMELCDRPSLLLLCGRYEGVDQRLLDRYVHEEISLGDFVLSGGELPAMVLMDAIIRQLPNVLNDSNSVTQESFVQELLECPHYTRPKEYHGLEVPSVLTSGNHVAIEEWRVQSMLSVTAKKRPDIIGKMRNSGLLSNAEESLLSNIGIGDDI